MQNEIGDNDNTGEKIQALAEKLIEPNAAIRVGRSVITQNTAGSLDLVINNTFISLIPDIEAVYLLPMKKDKAGKEILDVDCIPLIWDVPDLGMGVSQMSNKGYTYLVNDENAFLQFTDMSEAVRIYHRSKPHYMGLQQVKEGHYNLKNIIVQQNAFGGIDFVLNDIYVCFNCGVKAVYFMSVLAESDVNWDLWWDLFCDVTENRIAVVQRSKAGLTWWVYDEKAYVAKCERNGELDPTQFKISPKTVY